MDEIWLPPWSLSEPRLSEGHAFVAHRRGQHAERADFVGKCRDEAEGLSCVAASDFGRKLDLDPEKSVLWMRFDQHVTLLIAVTS